MQRLNMLLKNTILRVLCICLVIVGISLEMGAQSFSLLKDINPGSASSNACYLARVNNTLFFAANNGVNGMELWKTDGTEAGTVLVKDINAGSASASMGYLTQVNDYVFFVAQNGTNGTELWKSDGTATGTVMVKDIRAGSMGSNPSALTNVNGILYFAADDGYNGVELWKTDGTAAGTIMVKDINPYSGSSHPQYMVDLNGTLYFGATDGQTGMELWKSDGTAAGTVLVKDIWTGEYSGGPFWLVNVNGTLFFAASDGIKGTELWKSDGTATGTVLVKDIWFGGDGSYPYDFKNVNGVLFFTAADSTHGTELWKTDGTSAGTVLVKDIRPGAEGGQLFSLFQIANKLIFGANDGVNGYKTWESDGTAAGTKIIVGLGDPGNGFIRELVELDNKIFAAIQRTDIGREIWFISFFPLAPGTITPKNQTIQYNTIPDSLVCSAATGGICNGNYSYQWQFSNDSVLFEDIELDTSINLIFEQELTTTIYFRRRVVCGTDSIYSDTALVTVSPPFNAGSITSGNQSIDTNTVPATITASATQNCSGSVSYQWQSSLDGYNFSSIAGTNSQNLTYTTPINQHTYFRRKAICDTITGYTNVIIVAIKETFAFAEPAKNEIDTLFAESGINLDTLFHLQPDSLANERRAANNPFASLDSSTALNFQLQILSGIMLDSSDLYFADTSSRIDNTDSLMAIYSEGGLGSDSAEVYSPFMEDSVIQSYRSAADYVALDSIVQSGTTVSFEDAYLRLSDTTLRNCGNCIVSNIPDTIPLMKRSIVISGESIVQRDSVFRYYGSLYFPTGSTPNIMWNVSGGDIVAQNTNPVNGAIYADVRWRSSFGVPHLAVFDWSSGQFGVRQVLFH